MSRDNDDVDGTDDDPPRLPNFLPAETHLDSDEVSYENGDVGAENNNVVDDDVDNENDEN